MAQYNKFFDKSEIEYITPFLKLWMSFNNWYKQNVKIKDMDEGGNIKKDADGNDKEKSIESDRMAIEVCKKQGQIKKEFLILFDQQSDDGIKFQNALYELISNLENYNLRNRKNKRIEYEYKLISKNENRKELIYISIEKKFYQINEQEKETFFEQTLEIVYQIRCNLVHGCFDIEDQYFIKLVECSYKILYPIMERILQNIEK